MSLDLHKLENKLDETLNNETSQELFKWLNYKRRELINSNKKYLEIPHRETIISTNTLQTKPFDNQKIQIMGNKKETAVMQNPLENLSLEELIELKNNKQSNFLTASININGEMTTIHDYTKHFDVYQILLIYMVKEKIAINYDNESFNLTYGEIADFLIEHEILKRGAKLMPKKIIEGGNS